MLAQTSAMPGNNKPGLRTHSELVHRATILEGMKLSAAAAMIDLISKPSLIGSIIWQVAYLVYIFEESKQNALRNK